MVYHKYCCFFALRLSTVWSLSEKKAEKVQREGRKMAFEKLEWSVREKKRLILVWLGKTAFSNESPYI